jgi:hypothetical protein
MSPSHQTMYTSMTNKKQHAWGPTSRYQSSPYPRAPNIYQNTQAGSSSDSSFHHQSCHSSSFLSSQWPHPPPFQQCQVHQPRSHQQPHYQWLVQLVPSIHPAQTAFKVHRNSQPQALLTGKQITSYCKLMQDPATLDVWMHPFGKDFGQMGQGDNKMGTKGTDAIFIKEPKDLPNIPKDQPPTYPKVIVAYHLQKEDPYRI